MNTFIKNLYNKKIYIISPHFDDAVLSCGQLLLDLSGKAEVHIINVFTQAHEGPYTLSGLKYLSLCGNYTNASNLYSTRKKEDKNALKQLDVQIINLNFQDALFRKKKKNNVWTKLLPEFSHMYPLFRFSVMKNHIAKEDDSLQILKEKLENLIPEDAIVLCPFAQSQHVDHFIAKQACEAISSHIIYYSEFPYNTNDMDKKQSNYNNFIVDVNAIKKNKLITYYTTQLPALFPKGVIPFHKEIFLVKKQMVYETKIFSMISRKLLHEWIELWKNSKNANYVNSPEWFLSVHETFPDKKFRIVTLYSQQKLIGIVGLFQDIVLGVSLYTAFPEDFICGNPILIDTKDKKILKIFLQAMLNLGVVSMSNIQEHILKQMIHSSQALSATSISQNYYCTFQSSIEKAILAKIKTKLFKKIKLSENDFALKGYDGLSDDAWNSVFAIDEKSRKKERGYNIFAQKIYQNFYKSLGKQFKKSLRIHIVFFENKPIIYEIGFLLQNTYFGSQMAYDRNYAKYSPGKIILIKIIEELSKQKSITLIDFGAGTNEFKRSFTETYYPLYRIFISKNILIRNYLCFLTFIKMYLYNFFQHHVGVYIWYRKLKNIL